MPGNSPINLNIKKYNKQNSGEEEPLRARHCNPFVESLQSSEKGIISCLL